MNIHLALLLTKDSNFEKVVIDALKESGAKVLTKHDVDQALEVGCSRINQFDVVIIDRSDCHAITLLSALKACRHDLPVFVVTARDAGHCAALAYANGADACINKPIAMADLELLLHEFSESKLKLAAC